MSATNCPACNAPALDTGGRAVTSQAYRCGAISSDGGTTLSDACMDKVSAPPAPPRACASCRFWHCWDTKSPRENAIGECRRRAPLRRDDLSEFPPIFGGGWCGEYER